MEQLIASGRVNRGQLGVTTISLTPEFRKSLALPDNVQGALVSQVSPASAAERAGIEAGDLITSVRGQPIRTNSELANTIGMLKVGESVQIGLLREGKPQTVTAVLREPAQIPDASTIHPALAGAELVEVAEDSAGGVRIRAVAADSPAAQAGLLADDRIIAVRPHPGLDARSLREAPRVRHPCCFASSAIRFSFFRALIRINGRVSSAGLDRVRGRACRDCSFAPPEL